jgi:hypothetical protein
MSNSQNVYSIKETVASWESLMSHVRTDNLEPRLRRLTSRAPLDNVRRVPFKTTIICSPVPPAATNSHSH